MRLDVQLDRTKKLGVTVFAAALVLVVEVLDYWVAGDADFTILQVLPVLGVAWFAGRNPALLLSALGGCAWVAAHLLSGRYTSHPAIAVWNAAGGFAFLCIIVLLLTRLRGDLSQRSKLVEDLQSALREGEKAQQEIAQKASELARSNEELEQYANVAAHDLKSPVVAIGGFAQLLRRRAGDALGPEGTSYVDEIIRGANRMQDLIDDLLHYAKVGAERSKPELVNAEAALDEALGILRGEIESSGATVERGLLPVVPARRAQFVRLLQNLLSNAMKFRGPKPPIIRVGAQKGEQGWVFFVSDNGTGIEAPHLEEIFGLFHRPQGSSQIPGTGLGLAICRKIVETHGGRIWAESHAGNGATFRFTLPEIP